MEQINLSTLSNQSFHSFVDGYKFGFRLHYFRGVLYCDVGVDDVLVAASVRCCPDAWLVPYEYTHGTGNFRFETTNAEYPDADNFGTTCFLTHYSQDEIDEMNNG